MKFKTTEQQDKRIDHWLKNEVYSLVISKQKETMLNVDSFVQDCWDDGYPYQGTIGGGLTYSFTPTSIGVIESVTYGEYKLDLTDYDSW